MKNISYEGTLLGDFLTPTVSSCIKWGVWNTKLTLLISLSQLFSLSDYVIQEFFELWNMEVFFLERIVFRLCNLSHFKSLFWIAQNIDF